MKPRQIYNFLNENSNYENTLKQIQSIVSYAKIKQCGQNEICLGDLVQCLSANSKAPEDEDTPFVIYFEHSSINDKEPYFRFAATSKKMLKNGTTARHIHIDSTYKIVWQGYPLFVIGTTDLGRHFHPILFALCMEEKTEDYEFVIRSMTNAVFVHFGVVISPRFLISDAAQAIINDFKKNFLHQTALCVGPM